MAIQEEIRKGRDINGRFLIIGNLFSGPCQAKGPKNLANLDKGSGFERDRISLAKRKESSLGRVARVVFQDDISGRGAKVYDHFRHGSR